MNVAVPHCWGNGHSDPATFQKYLAYYRSGHFAVALECLERLPAEEIVTHPFHFLRGELLLNIGRYDAANDAFLRSESESEMVPDHFLLLKGRCAIKMGRIRDAVALFTRYSACDSSLGVDRDYGVALAIIKSFSKSADRSTFLDHCERMPSCRRTIVWRGIVASFEGKRELATRMCDAFLKNCPDDQRCLFWRCRLAIQADTPGIAVRCYRKLIEIDPAHAGGFGVLEVPVSGKTYIPPYGIAQVKAVIKDRPVLGVEYDEHNPLHVWAASHFASRVDGAQIEWSNQFEAIGEIAAYHGYVHKAHKWVVCVKEERNGVPRSADQQWMLLLFELENVKNQLRYTPLRQLAAANKIDQKGFVTRVLTLEFEAQRRAKAFYALVYYPWAVTNKCKTSIADWQLGAYLTSDDMLADGGESSDVWKMYCHQYEQLRKGAVMP